jgi:4-amino-4-deoxy-L-arabinose transferase-like glycosyltransferase
MYWSDRKLNIIYIVLALILLSVAFYNIFYNLGEFPIYSWDEARHGVNAYEMLRQGNFIVNTYRYKMDYWNLKPPLSYWAIMAGYKTVGFNALGLRLVSGICAMLTIIIVGIFAKKNFGNLASLLSMLALLTSTQYLTNHSARTGDADSLYVFLFTVAILSLLLSVKNDNWLYVSGLGFALAFLTKSWHAGNIAVIMALYLIVTGKYKKLSIKKWMILCLCMMVPILIWAVMRYQYDGFTFFQNMIDYDLLHRSTTPIEGHVGDESYYGVILCSFYFWWLVILLGMVLVYYFLHNNSLDMSNSEKRSYIIGICLWVIVPFILYTFAKTKIRWYILPIYPPLSIMIGILASRILMKGRFLLRIVLLSTILFVAYYYEGEIQTYVNNPIPNAQLSLIEKTKSLDGVRGYSLYKYHSKRHEAYWAQSAVLTAELANDLKVQGGDFHAFLKDDKALLLMKKRPYTKRLVTSNHLNIVASNNWGYILSKEKIPMKHQVD